MNAFISIWMMMLFAYQIIIYTIRLLGLFSKSSFFKKQWVLKITEVTKDRLTLYYLIILAVLVYGVIYHLQRIIEYFKT